MTYHPPAMCFLEPKTARNFARQKLVQAIRTKVDDDPGFFSQVFFPAKTRAKTRAKPGAKTSSPLEDSLNSFFFRPMPSIKNWRFFFASQHSYHGNSQVWWAKTNTWDLGELLQLVFGWGKILLTWQIWHIIIVAASWRAQGCRKSAEVRKGAPRFLYENIESQNDSNQFSLCFFSIAAIILWIRSFFNVFHIDFRFSISFF